MARKVKILRLTRHPESKSQLEELQRLYGTDCRIVRVAEEIRHTKRVLELIAQYNADVLEVVLPIDILSEVVRQRGTRIPIIRAVMRKVRSSASAAIFVFVRYERLVELKIVAKRL